MATINGIETEWTVIQRKFGNLPQKEPEPLPDVPKDPKTKLHSFLEKADDINALNAELDDEQNTETEEKVLEELKKLRLEKLKEEKARERFTGVSEISSDEYVSEVSEGSKAHGGIYVFCHLYADGKPACERLHQIMTELSVKHKYSKFCRIKGSLAIKNYPDSNCPTLLIYENGEMKAQYIGIVKFGGLNKMNWRTVEWELAKNQKFLKTEQRSDPFKASEKKNKHGDGGDDEEEEEDSDEDEQEEEKKMKKEEKKEGEEEEEDLYFGGYRERMYR